MHRIALRRTRIASVPALLQRRRRCERLCIVSPREKFRAEAAECLELANGWSGLIKDQMKNWRSSGRGWPGSGR